MSFVVIAHNLRSAHNVGSIFRTSDGAGVEKIFLIGYTPMPADESTVYMTRAHKDLAKTSLGAERTIPWEHAGTVAEVFDRLKAQGYDIVAVEQSENSTDYRSYQPSKPVALVVGNEVDGLDEAVLKRCDAILEIPMHGRKHSLNVSVAFGIAAFEIKSKLESMR